LLTCWCASSYLYLIIDLPACLVTHPPCPFIHRNVSPSIHPSIYPGVARRVFKGLKHSLDRNFFKLFRVFFVKKYKTLPKILNNPHEKYLALPQHLPVYSSILSLEMRFCTTQSNLPRSACTFNIPSVPNSHHISCIIV